MTIKQQGDERIAYLNNLDIFKKHNLRAVGGVWFIDGTTYCEIWNRSNQKRAKINTKKVFDIQKFKDDKEEYISSTSWFKNILTSATSEKLRGKTPIQNTDITFRKKLTLMRKYYIDAIIKAEHGTRTDAQALKEKADEIYGELME